MVILVLESCGQFLLRNKECTFRFNHMLEQIVKLRKVKNMAPAIDMQIENALMIVKPAAKSALKQIKLKSDLEEYIKYLFFDKLSENSLDEVAAKILTLIFH